MKNICKLAFVFSFLSATLSFAETQTTNSCDNPKDICEYCKCQLSKKPDDPDRINYITQCNLDCKIDLK